MNTRTVTNTRYSLSRANCHAHSCCNLCAAVNLVLACRSPPTPNITFQKPIRTTGARYGRALFLSACFAGGKAPSYTSILRIHFII